MCACTNALAPPKNGKAAWRLSRRDEGGERRDGAAGLCSVRVGAIHMSSENAHRSIHGETRPVQIEAARVRGVRVPGHTPSSRSIEVAAKRGAGGPLAHFFWLADGGDERCDVSTGMEAPSSQMLTHPTPNSYKKGPI